MVLVDVSVIMKILERNVQEICLGMGILVFVRVIHRLQVLVDVIILGVQTAVFLMMVVLVDVNHQVVWIVIHQAVVQKEELVVILVLEGVIYQVQNVIVVRLVKKIQ